MAVIFYLSGTGNSLYAAKKIAEQLEDCRLERIGDYLRHPYEVTDKIMGIVCPVYCFALPSLVERFVRQLQAVPCYCFGIVTMGAKQGRALGQLGGLLAEKRLRLNYGRTLVMPDNFMVKITKNQQKVLEDAEPVLETIAKEIGECRSFTGEINESFLAKNIVEPVSHWYLQSMLKVGSFVLDADHCVGCGLCSKLCPVGNITMEDGKPVFGKECAMCFGCKHWCPQNAICIGSMKDQIGKDYTNPNIKIQELFHQEGI